MKNIFFLFIIFFFIILNCKESEKIYETNLELKILKVIKKDSENKPLVIDVEVTYPDCPGTQVEIIRGDKNLANCVLKNYKVGDVVKGEIRWKWDSLGFYKWQIEKIGECERFIDPQDEFSYEMVEECEDYIVYGTKVGFLCKRVPTSNLIQKCPWFRRE